MGENSPEKELEAYWQELRRIGTPEEFRAFRIKHGDINDISERTDALRRIIKREERWSWLRDWIWTCCKWSAGAFLAIAALRASVEAIIWLAAMAP